MPDMNLQEKWIEMDLNRVFADVDVSAFDDNTPEEEVIDITVKSRMVRAPRPEFEEACLAELEVHAVFAARHDGKKASETILKNGLRGLKRGRGIRSDQANALLWASRLLKMPPWIMLFSNGKHCPESFERAASRLLAICKADPNWVVQAEAPDMERTFNNVGLINEKSAELDEAHPFVALGEIFPPPLMHVTDEMIVRDKEEVRIAA